jgi:hypothetical protein
LQVVKTTLAGVDVWKDERYIAEVSANLQRESDRALQSSALV